MSCMLGSEYRRKLNYERKYKKKDRNYEFQFKNPMLNENILPIS